MAADCFARLFATVRAVGEGVAVGAGLAAGQGFGLAVAEVVAVAPAGRVPPAGATFGDPVAEEAVVGGVWGARVVVLGEPGCVGVEAFLAVVGGVMLPPVPPGLAFAVVVVDVVEVVVVVEVWWDPCDLGEELVEEVGVVVFLGLGVPPLPVMEEVGDPCLLPPIGLCSEPDRARPWP